MWERRDAPMLAEAWAMPDPVGGEQAPGYFEYPFQHQTLLTSGQLAGWLQFPNVETNGFAITEVADFDVVAPPPRPGALELGAIVQRATRRRSPGI